VAVRCNPLNYLCSILQAAAGPAARSTGQQALQGRPGAPRTVHHALSSATCCSVAVAAAAARHKPKVTNVCRRPVWRGAASRRRPCGRAQRAPWRACCRAGRADVAATATRSNGRAPTHPLQTAGVGWGLAGRLRRPQASAPCCRAYVLHAPPWGGLLHGRRLLPEAQPAPRAPARAAASQWLRRLHRRTQRALSKAASRPRSRPHRLTARKGRPHAVLLRLFGHLSTAAARARERALRRQARLPRLPAPRVPEQSRLRRPSCRLRSPRPRLPIHQAAKRMTETRGRCQ